MFLHLGGKTMIKKESIIAILDIEKILKNNINNNYIKNICVKERISNILEQETNKSFIITNDGYYFSQISSLTLFKRSFQKNSII